MSVKINRIHESQIKLQDFSSYFWNTSRISESQCGFRKDRGTIDMIFTAKLQEKCQEQNDDLRDNRNFVKTTLQYLKQGT